MKTYNYYSSLAQSVEHAAVNRSVAGSSPAGGVWLHGQAVKTPPFHGGNRGSNPLGVTHQLMMNCEQADYESAAKGVLCRCGSIGRAADL